MTDYKLPIITGSSLSVGDLLRWDGSNWVNYPDSNYAGGGTVEREEVNILLNAFRLAINGSLVKFNLMDGIMDEFEDESGIDTGTSENETYDATDDLYSPCSNTVLLLHCNGTDGSTDIPDSSDSDHEVTCVGTAELDIDQKKFGTASVIFDGNSDYLSIPYSADFEFGNGDFTIDFQCRFNDQSSPALQVLFSRNPASDRAFACYFNNIDNTLHFAGYWNSAAQDISFAWSPTDDVWYHIAFVRNGADLKGYVNGTQVGDTYNFSTYSIKASASALYIGENVTEGGYWLNGWLDEIRIIKGKAKWTENFTPPTSEHDLMENMTLVSNTATAETEPDTVRITIFEEDVDAITINTDLKAYISRDEGVTYTQATLSDEGDYESGKQILTKSVDISGQPSGTSMKYKIETLNNKNLKLHGVGLLWK